MDPKFKVLKTSMEQYEVGGIRHALIYSQHVPNQRCDLSLYMPPQTEPRWADFDGKNAAQQSRKR